MLKKLGVLSFLIAATLHGEVSVELDKSVIKNSGESRKFIVEPKVSKNTYTVTQEQIQEKNYKNVEDVLRDAPGIVIQNTAFGPKVDMRGSGEKSFSRVKVMVDGISINPTEEAMASLPINSIPIESVKKIEIIPGGGATLYGSGSVGGVVNIITNSNATKDNFFMGLKYGSYDDRSFGFSGGHNVTDNMYVNYGFNYRNSAGYRESENKNNTLVLAGIDYKINSRNKLSFQIRNSKDKSNGTNAVSKKILERNRKAPGLNLDIDTTDTSYVVGYESKLSDDWAVASTFYMQEQKRDINTESIDDIKIIASDRKHTFYQNKYNFYDVKSTMTGKFTQKKYGVKVKTSYTYEKGNLILGYDFYNSNNKRINNVKSETLKTYSTGHSFINLSPSERKPIINRVNIDLTKEVHGLYGFNKYELTDSLSLTTGIRGEYTSYKGSRKNGPNVMPFVESKKQEVNTDKDLTNYAGELGFLYQYRDTGNVYLRYERSFVTPFASQLTDKIHDTKLKHKENGIMVPPIVNVASIYVANNLKPETIDTIELGMNDYIYNSLVSLSFFVTDTKDEITLIESGVTNPAIKRWKYRNIGKTRRMGVEFQAEQYLDKFTFTQSLSLVNAKVIEGDKKLKINKNDKIPMVPEAKLVLGVKYNLTPKFAVVGNYNYISKKEMRELGEEDNIIKYNINGYGVFDLSTIYQIDSYSSLKVGIKNLTSTKYNLRETTLQAVPAPTRNYFMELNVKF